MQPDSPFTLPKELTTYIPDSDLSVVSWNIADSQLTLLLEKEIGGEIVEIVMGGVSRICLAPWLELSGLELSWESRFLADPLDAGEFLLVIHGVSWENPLYVVARTIRCAVRNES